MKPFDENGAFAAMVPEGGRTLRRLAVRGAGMTTLSGGLSVGIQMIATVILARLLLPRDFGLVAMVTTFSLLLLNFGFNGITEALVQRREIDESLTSNLFWVMIAGGSLLSGVFVAAGPLLARFYGEPLLTHIAAALSITIFLTSASVVHLALLKRAMLFAAVAKNDIAAKAVSVAVSIFFACRGWGYWALVAGACALPLSTCVGAWFMCRWLPRRPRSAPGTRDMLKFAMYTYGRFSVSYFAQNSDNLLVGWRFGAVALGFYKKAYDLFSLSGSQVSSSVAVVAVAALSRVKENRDQYIRNLMGAMAVMALLGVAISGDLTLIGKDLIRVLLGPRWGPAGEIFTFFAPGIGVMFLYGVHGWIHLSIGRADRWFRWGLIEWTVIILLFLGGLRWGPKGIALAWCLSYWILTLPAMWYAGRPIGLSAGLILRTVWRYLAAGLLSYAATRFLLERWTALAHAGGAPGAALRIGAVTVVFGLLYLAAVVGLHGGMAPLERLAGLLRDMLSRGRAPLAEKGKAVVVPLLLLLVFAAHGVAQTASSNYPRGVVDWSQSGVGGIPPRTRLCARLEAAATVAQMNAALASCPAGETVYLQEGTYRITGTVQIPSNVTLRGAGADRTILNAVGTGGGDVIRMGSGEVEYHPRAIISGAGAGSVKLTLGDVSAIHAGSYLAIAEQNDPAYVSSAGSGGNCHWCDGWTKDGSLARGQIVAVTAVRGDTVSIAPGLYSAYTHEPIAVPFAMSASRAGVEDLQVYANNTGYGSNFGMTLCAYCWIKGVESNYADGDHVEVYWGYRDEIRDSYFSNAYRHEPGIHDSDIQIGWKTSATLVENNIIERTHDAVMLAWGAAGNVIAYNYTMGEFDSGAPDLDIGGIDFHGAHPQFNLIEGNVLTMIDADSVWGTSSDTTGFRNWVTGTNRICSPMNGRGPVTCAGANGHYGFQAARAIEMTYLSTRNVFIGNVVGSAAMQSLRGYHYPLRQQRSIAYPAPRSYDGIAFDWSFGYGATGDDGRGNGCGGGIPPCHRAGIAATEFVHGNYDNIGATTTWVPGVTRVLPASLYLKSKPAWWGAMPFPATGPDVSGGSGPGGHSYGNPARDCYLRVMHGSDGGAGSPLDFNAAKCYQSAATPSRTNGERE